MKVINLSSGSDGNLTYIESENSRILVDVGLSCKETQNRLALLGVDGKDIDAIIITHEHNDHIKGVDVLSRKYNIPIYAHEQVWANLYDKLDKVPERDKKIFTESFAINDLKLTPVEVPHDVKCFGYSIEKNEKKISILTDLGHTNERILRSVQGSQLIYLEANHDLSMLKNCEKYPLTLKMRIAGKNGHLSNDASAEFIEELIKTGTKQVVLSHLSTENNTPELAFNYISSKLADKGFVEGESFRIDVALTRPTTLFKLK
ncbi:MAG: MBL fold metallo-hydrolase [Clostridiales bacterium]|nr:MBL fold metallo-hydrolase [Clostridiales bacterium]